MKNRRRIEVKRGKDGTSACAACCRVGDNAPHKNWYFVDTGRTTFHVCHAHLYGSLERLTA